MDAFYLIWAPTAMAFAGALVPRAGDRFPKLRMLAVLLLAASAAVTQVMLLAMAVRP